MLEFNISLEPFYTYPGGEIGYDDGTAENARAFYDAGNGWGVKISLEEGQEKAIVTDGVFQFWDTSFPRPGGTGYVKVRGMGCNLDGGIPVKRIAGHFTSTGEAR